MFLTEAVERVVNLFQDADVVKVHWPLWEIDKNGRKTRARVPRGRLSKGDLRKFVARQGPATHKNPPTTGNAWARWFLEKVFPIPESEFKICADVYLLELAPLFGPIQRILEPQGLYRVHDRNGYDRLAFDVMLRKQVALYNHFFTVMSQRSHDWGLDIDLDAWKRKSWHRRLDRAMQEMATVIAPEDTFILVDQDQWGMTDGAIHQPIPFLERDGKYWGNPTDDETAIRELERLRRAGARFLVFGWPAFWWFGCYLGLHEYLRSHFRCVLENERLVIFDLRARAAMLSAPSGARALRGQAHDL